MTLYEILLAGDLDHNVTGMSSEANTLAEAIEAVTEIVRQFDADNWITQTYTVEEYSEWVNKQWVVTKLGTKEEQEQRQHDANVKKQQVQYFPKLVVLNAFALGVAAEDAITDAYVDPIAETMRLSIGGRTFLVTLTPENSQR